MVLTGALVSCALRLGYLTRSFKNLFLNGQKWKNSAIMNCSISARGAIKLHPFSTSAKQRQAGC